MGPPWGGGSTKSTAGKQRARESGRHQRQGNASPELGNRRGQIAETTASGGGLAPRGSRTEQEASQEKKTKPQAREKALSLMEPGKAPRAGGGDLLGHHKEETRGPESTPRT